MAPQNAGRSNQQNRHQPTSPQSDDPIDVKNIVINMAVAIGLLVGYFQSVTRVFPFDSGACGLAPGCVPWQDYAFQTIFIAAFCIYLIFMPPPLPTTAERFKYYLYSAAPFLFIDTLSLPYSGGLPLVFGLLPLFLGILLLTHFRKGRTRA